MGDTERAAPRTGTLPSMSPSTPFLSVDLERMQANIARTADAATARGLALRPHAKTHKTPQIAHLQLASGATGLTVATVSEAEAFADAGVTDLSVRLLPIGDNRDELIASKYRTREVISQLAAAVR